jgi:hypothetical protein
VMSIDRYESEGANGLLRAQSKDAWRMHHQSKTGRGAIESKKRA